MHFIAPVKGKELACRTVQYDPFNTRSLAGLTIVCQQDPESDKFVCATFGPHF